jgi:diaminohydroxyphosphoribosylaminopyrimidine deaminase/5-amino-6-(5-phosphoribosylamino)uracil reductase
VTLEPCAHQSPRGPTCCQIIAQSGITHVIAALKDPDPRTSGQGFAHLIAAGIKVEIGLLASEAQAIMADYLARVGG